MSTLANLTEVLFRLDFDPDTAVYHYRGVVRWQFWRGFGKSMTR